MSEYKIHKHKAIEDLLNQENQDDFRNGVLDELIYDLRRGQHFYLGTSDSYSDIMKPLEGKKLFEDETGLMINLPFNVSVFWFDVQAENSLLHLAIVVRMHESSKNIYKVKYIQEVNQGDGKHKKWMVSPFGSYINVNENYDFFNKVYLEELPSWFSVLSADQLCNKVFNYRKKILIDFLIDASKMDKNSREMFLEWLKEWRKDREDAFLSILDVFLMLINCQNITYETKNPPEKLNKKRREKSREEMVSYHVLNIAPTSPKKQTKNGATGAGEQRRVHLCRGHFKTYTEDAPLFGRFTGRFWWQHQVRGQDKSGIVHKDYHVEV